jgi:WD40 repeat protein
MDVPDNYYAILGVPIDADDDTLKRAYRQLARRYHPDLAGPGGAVHMKRINRAYDVLSDPEKRLNYDTIIGGVIDLRKSGLTRQRPVERKFTLADDIEFSGLSIFSTKGPFRTGQVLHTSLGVISSLSSVEKKNDFCIAAASLDGKGLLWLADTTQTPTSFASDAALTIESLRELRFSTTGTLLAGWGRIGLHIWDTSNGSLLWSYPLTQRAVSAHYSIDVVLKDVPGETQEVWIALPLLREDPRAPRALGVRGTDIVKHVIGSPADALSEPLVCAEDDIEKRQFWAIRLRTLSQDTKTLLTLSCAHVPGESNEMVIMRRWELFAPVRKLFAGKTQPQIGTSLLAGLCADCAPPYAFTPDTRTLAFVYAGKMIHFYDTVTGTYSEVKSGSMGASSRLAISPDAQWVAVAREDSEVNEGVIDLWSIAQGQVIQKLYHPWQISALHFANKQLIVGLTDGTIQVWKQELVAF